MDEEEETICASCPKLDEGGGGGGLCLDEDAADVDAGSANRALDVHIDRDELGTQRKNPLNDIAMTQD